MENRSENRSTNCKNQNRTDQVLWDEGANLLFPSMPAFNENWEILKQELKNK